MITTLTYNIAYAISSYSRTLLEKFYNEGTCNEYIDFTHYNFFYSYPEWGNKWPCGKDCEFHRVEIKCLLCDHKPERNYAGIGSIYLLHNGVSDDKILIINKDKTKEYAKNTPKLTRMICLCQEHISSHFQFNSSKQPIKNNQLTLF